MLLPVGPCVQSLSNSYNTLSLQWFNLVRSFCFGLSGAYDTFGSQAFGAGNQVGSESLQCLLPVPPKGVVSICVLEWQMDSATMHAGHGAVLGHYSYLLLAASQHSCQCGHVVCWGCRQSLFPTGEWHSQKQRKLKSKVCSCKVASPGCLMRLCPGQNVQANWCKPAGQCLLLAVHNSRVQQVAGLSTCHTAGCHAGSQCVSENGYLLSLYDTWPVSLVSRNHSH